jgi:hypothetical protein
MGRDDLLSGVFTSSIMVASIEFPQRGGQA